MHFKSTFPESIPPTVYKDSLSELLWHKLDVYKDKILFVDVPSEKEKFALPFERRWTGEQIKLYSSRLARYLIEVINLKPRDCCVLFCQNSDWTLLIALGILFAGGSICAGALEDPAEEHMYMINTMKPKVVFADKCIRKELLGIRASKKLDFKICIVNDDSFDQIDPLNGTVFLYNEDVLKLFSENDYEPRILPVQMNPDDPAFVLLTSGTTGRPKPVARSQRNSIYTCYSLDKAACLWDLNESSVMAGHLPLDHGTGIFNLKMTIARGLKLIIMRGYEMEGLLGAIERHKITDCMLGSGYLHNLMSAPDGTINKYDLSSLRNFIAVGSRVSSHELANQFMDRFSDLSVRQMFGMTECGLTSVVPREDSRLDSTSVGPLISNVIIKLIDQNTGAEIKEFDKPGELYVAGPMVAKGYLGAEFKEQSLNAFKEDGFYRTHDICFMSPNNRLTILGRDTEVLCVSDGWKVLPQEIESILMTHQGVQEVAIIGVPHPDLPTCDAPRAYVVPKKEYRDGKLTELDVVQFAASKLSEPKHLIGGVKLMEDLPRLSVGKVDKKALRKMDGF